VQFSVSAVMLRYLWTVEAFRLYWLTFPQLWKLIFILTRCTFLQSQLPFKLLAVLQSSSCYCSTTSHCSHVVPSQSQTPCDVTFTFISEVYFKISFQSSYLPLKAVDPHNFCVISMSSRGSCVCLLSTWPQWISIGHVSTLGRLTSQLGSAYTKGISLYWIASFVTGPALNGIVCVNTPIQKLKLVYSAILPTLYCPCRVNRLNSL
jgi:hypothetical protein